jgi:integrase
MTSQQTSPTALETTLTRYLQDKGKGRGGDSGHYRRNSAREIERFIDWAAGNSGPSDWTGIVPADVDRKPAFTDLDENVFREYARHLAGDRGLKQNTVQTYYAYVSSWCGWCVTEGYLDAHYAQRAGATAPLPDDDGRRPGDQQAWTPEQRHELTRHVEDVYREAADQYYDTPREHTEERAKARYDLIRAARDRALVYLVAYTALRIGELVRDGNDPRRRGVRWEDINLEDGSIDVFRKKQSWDSASLPEPVVDPVEEYNEWLDPPTETWPMFPTLHFPTVAERVKEELAARGLDADEVERRRDNAEYDLFLALRENIELQSISTDGARSALERITDASEVEVNHQKHEYLAPHGGRRGMGEVLVRAFGYTVAARYLDNSEEMVRKRYSHIEAGELGDKAAEAINDVDS